METKILLLVILSATFSCNRNYKDAGDYELNGNISGYDSSYVQLMKLDNGDLVTIDSVFISGGKFEFKGSVEIPDMYYLVFGDLKRKARIFLENSKITFNAHFDSLDIASISGSKSQDEYKAYVDEIKPFENKMTDLYQQYKAALDQKNKALTVQLDSTMESLDMDKNNFIKHYIVSHKSSYIAPYILYRLSYELEAKELDSLLGFLDKRLEPSLYTKNLKARVEILKKVEIGKKAPDFALNDTTGKPISLSSFKGKFVLIDFWASWCGPCRRENPNNVKLYHEFNPKGLEIFGVSLDNDKTQWIEAIKKDGLSWAQVSDLKFWSCEAAKLYGVNSIPHTILIDKEGTIIAKNLVGEELREKIKEVLK